MNITADNLKIVFAGSVGAGKTTSILSISDIDVVNTEEIATDEVQLMKKTTTVALDYGQMILGNETFVHLYGAPGQKRFDFMWEILSQGSLGVIVLIDDASDSPYEEIDAYMHGFADQLKTHSMVVGITRTDLNSGHSIEEYRQYIKQYDPTMPIFTLDAREKNQVRILVKTLLYRIDPWLN